MNRPPSIVISDWLANVRGQMTPFEAAHSLMNYLQDEGYYVMKPSDMIEAVKGVLPHSPGTRGDPMTEHTPTPWRVHTLYPSEIYATVDEKRMQIADISGACSQDQDEANAAFIVKAVNSHHPMREALLRLGQACEQLAATRSHAIYSAMIDGGQTQALLELDNARRCAREGLRDAVGGPGK